MEGRLLARAREKQEALRGANRREELRRRDEVYGRSPALRQTDAELRALRTALIALALKQPGPPAAELEERALALRAKRAELLRRGGWPEDYLEPVYACPRCRDTGWAAGAICPCLETLYKREQTLDLAPLLRQGEQTFETFRLDWYVAGEGPNAPRRRMERVYNACRRYAESFGPRSPNLLFTGGPGLGKTFLSAAIARVVAQRGFSVAYDTAVGLLSAFEQERFSRDGDEQSAAASRARQLLHCDLLILDDLGTEMPTAFTVSALYTLLDGRLRAARQTIVSTNLGRDALRERYGQQLASRLEGEYEWMEFTGRDIRALRKERGQT